jgi:hypothetical protein
MLSSLSLVLPQYSSSSDGGAIVIVLLIWLGLAIIPATIASGKGYSGVGFYLFGLFFFLPALIVALLMQPKQGSAAASPRPPAGPAQPPTSTPAAQPPPPSPAPVLGAAAVPAPPGALPASPPVSASPTSAPVAYRECPHCKESMRRDATVCPHCRRESDAWSFDRRVWWSQDASGQRLWLRESTGAWEREDALVAETTVFEVTLVAVGDRPEAVEDVLMDALSYARSGARHLVRNVPARLIATKVRADAVELIEKVARVGGRAELTVKSWGSSPRRP